MKIRFPTAHVILIIIAPGLNSYLETGHLWYLPLHTLISLIYCRTAKHANHLLMLVQIANLFLILWATWIHHLWKLGLHSNTSKMKITPIYQLLNFKIYYWRREQNHSLGVSITGFLLSKGLPLKTRCHWVSTQIENDAIGNWHLYLNANFPLP